MRNVSMFVGLTLLALAGTARAEEAAPAADKPAAAADKPASTAEKPAAEADKPAADKAAPADKADPADKTVADKAPAPEATKAVPAAAADVAAAPAPVAPDAGPRKWQLGLAFLPMSMGEYTYVKTTAPISEDAYFAYGASLSAVYEVLPGLLVGLAPQLTYNVRPKTAPDGGKELDLMARVAYAYRLPDGISIFAEVLPGYSMILLKKGAAPKGMVLAFGAGCAIDLTARTFASVGVGYQIGYQNQAGSVTVENRTRYIRVALGGGVRF